MKNIIYLWISIISCFASAQESDTITHSKFRHTLQTNLYFLNNRSLFSPVYSADKDKLHLEARYNYESKNTFSGWLGYNFNGGKNFEYAITPMVGGIVGDTKGAAPGLKIDLEYNHFLLSSESEYVFNFENKENNYFYLWNDLIFAPEDNFWFGLSIQRTRLYQTNVTVQRGLLIGGNYKWLNITGYYYNLQSTFSYFILSLSTTFSEK